MPSDFNGDGKTDIAVFRRAEGTPGVAYWKYLTSCDDTSEDSIQWGVSTDTPVPGDYDGSSATEPAIARPGTSQSQLEWWVYPGPGVEAFFSLNTDIPLPRDYVGADGETEIATVRPGSGDLLWLVRNEGTGAYYAPRSWGLSSDKLVPEDYDGDGKADPAVFRPSDGYWYIQYWSPVPSGPEWLSVQFGYSTDRPVPGDYDGDGKADLAVFRPSNGTWYILQSSTTPNTDVVQWGVSTDIPVPGDYNGDGKFDPAVFRPSTATWHILYSNWGGECHKQFGVGTDTPVPALYTPYYQ
ncbi:MAG TPA: VCBS repeat-containing protein [Thermoanaerobaculia bacterium]|nr:VCBS repeat-containing protein [Thermoanaerobaculia bacterium]